MSLFLQLCLKSMQATLCNYMMSNLHQWSIWNKTYYMNWDDYWIENIFHSVWCIYYRLIIKICRTLHLHFNLTVRPLYGSYNHGHNKAKKTKNRGSHQFFSRKQCLREVFLPLSKIKDTFTANKTTSWAPHLLKICPKIGAGTDDENQGIFSGLRYIYI